jgi:hypothetical protein
MAFLEGGCLFSGQSRDWGVWATCLKIREVEYCLDFSPVSPRCIRAFGHVWQLVISAHWFSHASVPMVIYPYIPGIYEFRNPESSILVAVHIITWNVPSDCQHISINYNQKN